jgi:hypothetical protein
VRKSGGEKFHGLFVGNLLTYSISERCNDENERGKELVDSDIIEISSDEEDRYLFVKLTVEK